ncbi:GTPase ObgE [Salinispira pacifica]
MERFVDEVRVHVASGHGGAGCVSFRREKYVPKGGPDGGDGGRGGDVTVVVRRNLKTLSHLRMHPHHRAENGRPGQGRNMHGRDGAPVTIPVPPGTIIRDPETREQVADLTEEGQSVVLLRGGRGGKGNAHFATSTHRTPRFAQDGEAGEEVDYLIELAVIADIGLVGFPNAGKSSLLKALTNANPRIGSYPFTTKIPNLGVLRVFERDIVLADIPGIIEGASGGAGLGIRFLKHISRTSGIALLIDLSDEEVLSVLPVLVGELRSYSPALEKKSRLVIGTKLDMPGAVDRLEELRAALAPQPVLGVSSFTREGLDEVARFMHGIVTAAEKERVSG